MPGLIDTIKLAGTLVLAIPAALAGLEFLAVRDEPLVGGTLLGLAVALVLVEQYLSFSLGLTGRLLDRVVDAVTLEPTDENADADPDGTEDEGATPEPDEAVRGRN